MSATQRGRKASGNFKRTVKFFNENFERKETTVEGSIDLAEDLQAAHALLGNDEAKIVAAINAYAKNAAIQAAIDNAQGQGLDEKAVMKFLKPYFEVPPYSDMEKKDATKALLEQVRNTPFMLDAIRSAATSDDEEEE